MQPLHVARKAASFLAVAGLTTSLLVGAQPAGADESAAAQPKAAIATADRVNQAAAWGPCPAVIPTLPGTQCATFTVPRDYADPQGPTIEVMASRLPATGERWGAIAGNPGGPGGPALGMFGNEGLTVKMPASVREHFDLIAVQPRGHAFSTLLTCGGDGKNPQATALAQQPGGLFRACELEQPGYAATVTTLNTARDMNAVREQLGDDVWDLYGLSYGTDLMSTYATTFPEHTRSVVLDSSVDPAYRWADLGFARERDRRDAFNASMTWIAEHNDTYHLGATPLEVYRRYLKKVEAEIGLPGGFYPAPASVGDLPKELQPYAPSLLPALNGVLPQLWRGYSGIKSVQKLADSGSANLMNQAAQGALASPTAQMAFQATYSERLRPVLAQTIQGTLPAADQEAQARPGGGANEEEAVQVLVGSTTVERAIICNDDVAPRDPSLLPAAVLEQFTGGDVFHLNALGLKSGILCAGWPEEHAAAQLSGERLGIKPLLLHYTEDSAVSGAAGKAMQRTMGGELVERPGHGHGLLVALNDADAVGAKVASYYLDNARR